MNLQQKINLATTFCTTDIKTVAYIKNELVGDITNEINELLDIIGMVACFDYNVESIKKDVKTLQDALIECNERLKLDC